MSRKRSRSEIEALILEMCQEGITLPQLMVKTYCTHQQIRKYTTSLIERQLLRIQDERYFTTVQGREFLHTYSSERGDEQNRRHPNLFYRREPIQRQPLQFMSGLIALIGVFFVGFTLYPLALIVIVIAISLFLGITFYPNKCPYCGKRISRREKFCEEHGPIHINVVVEGRRNWLYLGMNVLIGINGILFIALIVYLVMQIVI